MRHHRLRSELLRYGDSRLLKAVRDFLEDEGLDYQTQSDGFYLCPGKTSGGTLDCSINSQDGALLEVMATYADTVPKRRWDAVLKCLNSLNAQIGPGRFVLDPFTGQIGFRVTVLAANQEISSNFIKRHFDACLSHAALAQALIGQVVARELSARSGAKAILQLMSVTPRMPKPPHGYGWN